MGTLNVGIEYRNACELFPNGRWRMTRTTAVETSEGLRMPYNLNHTQLRHFAQQLRERTGRHIKHSEILKQVSITKGEPYDALMHRLKHNPTVTVDLDERDCFNLAQLLSTISGRMIEYNQVEINASDAMWLFMKDPDVQARAEHNFCTEIDTYRSTPTIFTFFCTDGFVRVSQKPEDECGFSLTSLTSVELALQAIAELDDEDGREGERKKYSFEPFTLRARIIDKEHGDGVFTGLNSVDRLYKWLSSRYSDRLTIIPDGNVFHEPHNALTLTSGDRLVAEQTRGGIEVFIQHSPTIHPLTAKSVRPFSPSEATDTQEIATGRLEKAYEIAQRIQLLRPDLWLDELRTASDIISLLAEDSKLDGDLKGFGNQLYRLICGLITLSKLHKLLTSPSLSEVDNAVETRHLIEEMILSDLARRRIGNDDRRAALVKDYNGSVKTLMALNSISQGPSSEAAVTLGSWLDACHAIASSPLWTVFDDVVAMMEKNVMSNFGGYRPRGWRAV
jgi:hypothetical protein